MRKTLCFLAVFSAVSLTCNPVMAAEHYISGMGGISWANKIHFVDTYQLEMYNDYQDYNLGRGFNVLGAVGCDYGSYRLEAEVGYQRNKVTSAVIGNDEYGLYEHVLDVQGNTSTDPWDMKGDVSVLSLMVNGYYDFKLGNKIELYATAGIGTAQVSLKNVHETITVEGDGNGGYILYPNTSPGFSIQETTLAWQVGAGIAVPVAKNVKVDLRYRYFATTDFTLPGTGSYYYNYNTGGSEDSKTNFSSHSILLGLRVGF